MKKIIALALALIMALSMGSVAFAADVCGAAAGKADGVALTCEVEGTTHLEPGEKYIIWDDFGKDLKVTGEWTKGGALVASIYFDKKATVASGDYEVLTGYADGTVTFDMDSDGKTAGAWILELKENYTITDAKALEGKLVVSGKVSGEKKTDKLTFKNVVSNHLVTLQGEEEKEDAAIIEAANNTLYACEEDWDGYVKFNKGALLSATLNMVGKEKAFMYNDEKAIEALEEKFPEAEIECYNFGGEPTFKNAAEFALQADYADQYFIYSYANGKLEAQDAEWNSIEGVYEWSTKTPASYVISDVELVAAADDAATTNPDTGANDVVGVAAALAVVSLVAAGAVSLKK